MYLLHILNNLLPVFILVLPFEQKHLASQAGFKWNNPQPGAWATSDFSTALAAVRNNINTIVVAQPTLNLFLMQGKILPATYDRLADRLESYQPDRKAKAAIAAATLIDKQVEAMHTALQNLAAVCDGSLSEDGTGFNRNDVEYGHSLAGKVKLTRTDAGYASQLLYKYRGQIGEDLFKVIFPDVYAREQKIAQEKQAKKDQNAADKLARENAKDKERSEKRHKRGLTVCDWQFCPICSLNDTPELQASYDTDKLSVINKQLAENHLPQIAIDNTLSNSAIRITAHEPEPLGHYIIAADPATGKDSGSAVIFDKNTKSIVSMTDDQQKADPEIIKLATSLIDCFEGDFDTTVDMLRTLRKIDAPKEAKSQFLKDTWSAAGYETK